jgi:HipA-like C-terminal domain
MRPPNHQARSQLLNILRRGVPLSATELARTLGVSVATLHRLLGEWAPQIVTHGQARRTRYAARRTVRGEWADWPLYEIDATGRAHSRARLTPLAPQGSHCAGWAEAGWPVPPESRDGWWEGLPYPLHDMRPQGYIGRQIARAEHPSLGIGADPDRWSDDDVLIALSRIGSDLSGSFILGDVALARWQHHWLTTPPEPHPAATLAAHYGQLAEQALAIGVPGSSAAGEFPKFCALRDDPTAHTPHVLVKFSGADGSPAVQRWADLLICEHLALRWASTLTGVEAAHSRLLQAQGRTFLEVERFDRHGLLGRSPLVSLGTLDAALLGSGSSDWPDLAARLVAAGWLAADALAPIHRLWWFGKLIANSDMHTGNLSFRPHSSLGLQLAPAYDMLPMLYAPLPGGELPTRTFQPALPLPPQRDTWQHACQAAQGFWAQAARDSRISPAFRQQCQAHHTTLQRLAERV